MTFNIIRRAFSNYSQVETFEGSWLDAEMRAMELQFSNNDGEYLVRKPGQPNWEPTGSVYQSGFDYL